MKLTNHRCQCAACGEVFTRTSSFDKHRTGQYAKPGEWAGDRRCMTIGEMLAKGMARNADGVWAGSARLTSEAA